VLRHRVRAEVNCTSKYSGSLWLDPTSPSHSLTLIGL
jgi:hypothetical protein